MISIRYNYSFSYDYQRRSKFKTVQIVNTVCIWDYLISRIILIIPSTSQNHGVKALYKSCGAGAEQVQIGAAHKDYLNQA